MILAAPFLIGLGLILLLPTPMFRVVCLIGLALLAYVIDGQTTHPLFPHRYDVKSAAVR